MAFDRVFMISAIERDGVGDVLEYFADTVPVGPWHYPEDEISDLPMRLLAAEITREQSYLRLHAELPYALAVETRQLARVPRWLDPDRTDDLP